VNPLVDRDRRLVIAHRGASAHAPENTLPAFELAVAQGADAFDDTIAQLASMVPASESARATA